MSHVDKLLAPLPRRMACNGSGHIEQHGRVLSLDCRGHRGDLVFYGMSRLFTKTQG